MIMSILIKKTGRLVDFDVESLPPASMEYVIRNGLTQRLNDVHSAVSRKDYADGELGDAAFIDDVHAKVDHAVEQITSGNVPGVRAVANPGEAKAKKAVAELLTKGFTLEQIAAFAEKMTSGEMAKAA